MMIIAGEQLWNNLFLLAIMALIVELAVSGLFSIKYLETLIQSDNAAQNMKNVLVIVIAFGLCAKIPQLRILYKSSLPIPDTIHMVLTAFILSRVSNLFNTWFESLKMRRM